MASSYDSRSMDTNPYRKMTTLTKVDDGLYVAYPEDFVVPSGSQRLWGGQMMGLALGAAQQSWIEYNPAREMEVHYIQCLFLAGGDPNYNIVFEIRELRTGTTFAQKAVFAKQRGQTIFSCLLSLVRKGQASPMDYHDPMPIVPEPDNCMSRDQFAQEFMADVTVSSAGKKRFAAYDNIRKARHSDSFITTMYCPQPEDSVVPKTALPTPLHPGRRTTWVRINDARNDPPMDQTLAMTMMSDSNIAMIVMDAWGLEGHMRIIPSMMATLNHTLWFHDSNFDMNEWMLFDYKCSKTAHNRGVVTAQVFTYSGRLVVTITQEVLIRHFPDAKL